MPWPLIVGRPCALKGQGTNLSVTSVIGSCSNVSALPPGIGSPPSRGDFGTPRVIALPSMCDTAQFLDTADNERKAAFTPRLRIVARLCSKRAFHAQHPVFSVVSRPTYGWAQRLRTHKSVRRHSSHTGVYVACRSVWGADPCRAVAGSSYRAHTGYSNHRLLRSR